MATPLQHVVLFTFRPELDAATIDAALQRFVTLAQSIASVAAMQWGENISTEGLSQGYTHCFLLRFADATARDAYLSHPEHQAFVAFIVPLLTQACVVDFVGRVDKAG